MISEGEAKQLGYMFRAVENRETDRAESKGIVVKRKPNGDIKIYLRASELDLEPPDLEPSHHT